VFAKLPEPPYYAVIFSSLRNGDDEAGYAEAADRMLALAAQQPGYLGAESTRGSDGFGITVSYWASEAAPVAWGMTIVTARKLVNIAAPSDARRRHRNLHRGRRYCHGWSEDPVPARSGGGRQTHGNHPAARKAFSHLPPY